MVWIPEILDILFHVEAGLGLRASSGPDIK
jgi:hypothetical protein